MSILLDSNIPMYLVGKAHPHKIDAQELLQAAIGRGERLVTDVEVLQEILHRYVALDRREAGLRCGPGPRGRGVVHRRIRPGPGGHPSARVGVGVIGDVMVLLTECTRRPGPPVQGAVPTCRPPADRPGDEIATRRRPEVHVPEAARRPHARTRSLR